MLTFVHEVNLVRFDEIVSQVRQDDRMDGQCGDGYCQGLFNLFSFTDFCSLLGVCKQSLHLGRVQKGEGQLPVPLQELGTD